MAKLINFRVEITTVADFETISNKSLRHFYRGHRLRNLEDITLIMLKIKDEYMMSV